MTTISDLTHITLPPQFAGSVDYYALIARANTATIHTDMRFDKRFKSAHRTLIADTRGTLALTIPIEKPCDSSSATWNTVRISDHNKWWNIHLTALESAYGRTPFFEFYIDSLKPFFSPDVAGQTVAQHTTALDICLRRLLNITTDVTYTHLTGSTSTPTIKIEDIHNYATTEPYWQVRQHKFGFISGLSILDLLFNLGPEATFTLAP